MTPASFESETGMGPRAASQFLGVSYRSWMDYKSGVTKTPKYISVSIAMAVKLHREGLLND